MLINVFIIHYKNTVFCILYSILTFNLKKLYKPPHINTCINTFTADTIKAHY